MTRTIAAFLLLLTLPACAPYKVCTPCYVAATSDHPEEQAAADHWLYTVVPRHRSQIHWYDIGHWTTWCLFGNDDDGLFGEAPTANYATAAGIGAGRAVAWTTRNPMHNLCFYVLGGASQESVSSFTLLRLCRHHVEMMRYRPVADTVFAAEHSCLYIALHGWLPFVSMRLCHSPCHRADFYVGWRERRNFGIKCNPIVPSA